MSPELEQISAHLARRVNGFEGLPEVVGKGIGGGDGLPSGLDLNDFDMRKLFCLTPKARMLSSVPESVAQRSPPWLLPLRPPALLPGK